MGTDSGSSVKPCPFCGGDAHPAKMLRDGYEKWPEDEDAWSHFYRCRCCAAEGPWCKSGPEGALTRWNRRVAR